MAYADENYMQNKNLYDAIAQVFENYKYGAVSSGHSWNKPVQEITGVTMRFLGEGHLEITYHRYEVTTTEGIDRIKQDDPGAKFVAEVAKALKKEFKKETQETLTLTKLKEKPINLEKASRLSAENSWLLGSSRYGHGARPTGRYLVRTSCVYEFSSRL